MNQNQDELQAAINDITNAATAGAGGAVDMAAAAPAAGAAPAADDIVAQIQSKVATETAAAAAVAPAIEPIKVEQIVEAPVTMPAVEEPKMEIEGAGAALTTDPKTYTTIDPDRAIYGDPDLDRVKIGALNEIRPILETADVSPEKKFLIYKDIIELTEDKSCIELAFNASCKIEDEKMRAEALLYVIEVIDDLGIKMEAEKAGK